MVICSLSLILTGGGGQMQFIDPEKELSNACWLFAGFWAWQAFGSSKAFLV
jgi:hypothetical protein